MPIIYNEKTREFHLYNQEISYIIKILDNDQPGQLYYGKRLTHREDFSHLFEYAMRDMSPYAFEGNSTFSLENIKQEYPTFGCGDMRFPAYEIERENGSHVVEFVYKEHKIYNGKPKLEGLPATYVESDDEAQTLELVLEDTSINTRIVLLYTIYEAFPVIARSVRFECDSDEKITLLSAMSACVDLPDKDYEMIDLAGVWARERYVRRHKLDYGIQSIYSMRGCSSYQFNPFLALARENADEFQGQVYGFSLVYSGNFLAQTEVDNYDTARVLMGIHPNGFKWTLGKGESFQTPEMVMVYSEAGLNGMSQTFHKLYRTRLARGTWRDKVRPILINSWEAFYFDFDAPKLLGLADAAADLGMELFVLDDGGFGAVLMNGVKRGLFSNEAGSGSAPCAAAAAECDTPVKAGFIQALGVFIDTIVICSCTAMIMLLVPEKMIAGLEGMELLQTAMNYHLGKFGVIFIAVTLFLFSFSTFLGILFYARGNVAYLLGDKWCWQTAYKILALVMLFIGGIAAYHIVWDLGDVGIGLMTIFNIVTLYPMGGEALEELRKYEKNKQ